MSAATTPRHNSEIRIVPLLVFKKEASEITGWKDAERVVAFVWGGGVRACRAMRSVMTF